MEGNYEDWDVGGEGIEEWDEKSWGHRVDDYRRGPGVSCSFTGMCLKVSGYSLALQCQQWGHLP